MSGLFQLSANIGGFDIDPYDLLEATLSSDVNQVDWATLIFSDTENRLKDTMSEAVEVIIPTREPIFQGKVTGVEPSYTAGQTSELLIRAKGDTMRHFNKLGLDKVRRFPAYLYPIVQEYAEFVPDWSARVTLPLGRDVNSHTYALGAGVEIHSPREEPRRGEIIGIFQKYNNRTSGLFRLLKSGPMQNQVEFKLKGRLP